MPIGEPKQQTIASKKYQDKVGLISKSYKLKRELTEEFAEACSRRGVSASAAITEFMEKFVRDTEENA